MYLCLLLYFDVDAFENPPLIGITDIGAFLTSLRPSKKSWSLITVDDTILLCFGKQRMISNRNQNIFWLFIFINYTIELYNNIIIYYRLFQTLFHVIFPPNLMKYARQKYIFSLEGS